MLGVGDGIGDGVGDGLSGGEGRLCGLVAWFRCWAEEFGVGEGVEGGGWGGVVWFRSFDRYVV